MKNTGKVFATAITLTCLGILSMAAVRAVSPGLSARGSAGSEDLQLAFSAAEHRDESIRGHAVFHDRAANTIVGVDIDCLSAGQVAVPGGSVSSATLIGGVSKSTADLFHVGNRVAFLVVVYNLGQFPDQFTGPALAGAGCDGGINQAQLLLIQSEQGNIVITLGE